MAGTGEKQNPSGAAAETSGCRGRNHWVPWEKPMVSAEAPKRLLPFAAAKIPYVVNLVGYGWMSDAVLGRLIQMFG